MDAHINTLIYFVTFFIVIRIIFHFLSQDEKSEVEE